MSKFIGLVGFKRVGKSTAAKYLEENYGFVRHNFKDALVSEITQNFPDLLDVLSRHYEMDIDQLFFEKPPAMRALMQNYGTEVRRGDRDDYWTDKWQETIPDSADCVADDVRFLNEADKIKEQGGVLIRLVRTDIDSGGNHQSETGLHEIESDFTIVCEGGDHEHLYKELDRVIATMV